MAEEHQSVLTTGDVARICSVAPRTASKWLDSGKLRGWRVPGSRDRRVRLEDLIVFMRENGYPIDMIPHDPAMKFGLRIVVIDTEAGPGSAMARAIPERIPSASAVLVSNYFDAGVEVAKSLAHVVIADARRIEDASAVVKSKNIASEEHHRAGAKPLACAAVVDSITSGQSRMLVNDGGFDAVLRRPFRLDDLIEWLSAIRVMGALVFPPPPRVIGG